MTKEQLLEQHGADPRYLEAARPELYAAILASMEEYAAQKVSEVSENPIFDFSTVADEYMYFAIDADGDGFAFQEEPQIVDNFRWHSNMGKVEYVGEFDPITWKTSLQKRK